MSCQASCSHGQGGGGGLRCRSPYPDEVIMLALDRILYYLGATKIFHQLESGSLPGTVQKRICAPNPTASETVTCSTSTCNLMDIVDVSNKYSNSSLSKYSSARSKNSIKNLNTPKTSSCKSKSTLNKVTVPASNPRLRTARVDFAHPVVDNRLTSGGPSISARLKQSFSTCSLACLRFKGKLSSNNLKKEQNFVWTRLVNSEKGSKVYEVYQNSGTNKKPWKNSNPKQPVIVFLVLPNGVVMPFETLSSNFKNPK